MSDPGRILVRVPNPLGDAIMALPAMEAIRNGHRSGTLILAAPSSIAPLFHEATSAAPDVILSVDKESEREALRDAKADAVVLLPNSFRAAWVSRQAGIAERWGYRAHGRALLLTRGIQRPRGKRHQSEYYLHLASALGFPVENRLPRVVVSPQTRSRAEELLASAGIDRARPVVGIAPGAAYGHAKRWPPKRMSELVARLHDAGAGAVLVGAEGDRGAGREIESSLPAGVRVVNLIARTDIRALAGLLAACDAFVSNDSGAMHLAAAVGVPVAAIFGPTDERVTAPLGDHDVIIHQVFCRPCMLRDCPIDHRCMRGIGVERVFEAVSQRLARSHSTA